MSLRTSETVVGPTTGGRAYYHGMTEPIDFHGAYDPPAVSSITRRAIDAGHDVSFTSMQPLVETAADLATLLVVIEARVAAGSPVPEATTDALYDLDIRANVEGRSRTVERA
jgi:hypothetical protein